MMKVYKLRGGNDKNSILKNNLLTLLYFVTLLRYAKFSK